MIAAGIIGFIGARTGSGAFRVGGGHGSGAAKAGEHESLLGDALPQHARPTVGRALRVSALWLALWLVPVIALYAVLGTGNVYTDIGGFFSKMAVVTFSGRLLLRVRSTARRSSRKWRKTGIFPLFRGARRAKAVVSRKIGIKENQWVSVTSEIPTRAKMADLLAFFLARACARCQNSLAAPTR